MLSLRRAVLRAISSRVSYTVSPQPRSITSLTTKFSKSTRSSILPSLQKRFVSDDQLTKDEAPSAEPIAPESQSAAEFDASDIDPTPMKEVPETEPQDTAYSTNPRTRLPPRNTAPTKQIFVGNLFFDVTEEDLRREFSRFGTITNLRVIKDTRGVSKGFAYVDFLEQGDATNAKESLHQQVFEGRRLAVHYALPRSLDQINRARDRLRKDQASNPPSRTIYLGNLSFDLTDQDMGTLFNGIKNVTDVRVAIDRRTGQPRGFCHVDFTDIESAEQAFKQLNGKEVFGRLLRCDFSAPSARARVSRSEEQVD